MNVDGTLRVIGPFSRLGSSVNVVVSTLIAIGIWTSPESPTLLRLAAVVLPAAFIGLAVWVWRRDPMSLRTPPDHLPADDPEPPQTVVASPLDPRTGRVAVARRGPWAGRWIAVVPEGDEWRLSVEGNPTDEDDPGPTEYVLATHELHGLVERWGLVKPSSGTGR